MAAFILVIIQLIVCTFSERKTRIIFTAGFLFLSFTSNFIVMIATYLFDSQQYLFFMANIALNVANSMILIVLVSTFYLVAPTGAACFSINLINSIYSLAIVISRLLLGLQDYWSGQSITDLNFERFKIPATINVCLTIVFSLLLIFKVKL